MPVEHSRVDRKQHWENVYATRSPLEVSWYQREPALSLELIRRSGVGPDDALIDVGGGASLLVDRLLAAGHTRVAVLDLSAAALAHARSRLGDAAARVQWFEADVTRFVAPQPFVLWHDRAVLHFLTDPADQARYVATLERTLAARGHVILAAFARGGPTQCSGLDIVQYDAARVQALLGARYRLLEERAERHRTPAGKEQAFAFFRLQRSD